MTRLVFIHGAGGQPSHWAAQLAAFPGSQAVSLAGHQINSEATLTVSSIEGHAHYIHEQLKNLEADEQIILVGHSMGGAIAQAYALLFPEQVAGLVLVATGAKIRVSAKLLNGFLTDYPATVKFLVDSGFAPGASEKLKRPVREDMENLPAEVTHADFAACNDFDFTAEIYRLTVPTLVLAGSLDALTPLKLSQFLADTIPGAQLEVLEGAGHFLQLEKPAQFNQLLADFAAKF